MAKWARDILKESLEEETDFHETAVERLKLDLARIKRDMDQAYRDRLDGRISEEFWGECSAQWEAERQRITKRLVRHEKPIAPTLTSASGSWTWPAGPPSCTTGTVCWSAGASWPRSSRT